MAKHSKRYLKISKQVNPQEMYELEDAINRLKRIANAKFDETVEFVVNLDIDPKQANQQIRGSFLLPHGVGKTKRVIAFCGPDQSQAALDAGAVAAGLDDLVAKIEGGWMEFDVAVCTQDARRVVGKLGRILGARGLMPNPKSGTVGNDIPNLVKEFTAGKIEYRNDDTGNIHAPVGKVSFDAQKIVENIRAFYAHILERRPATLRGNYVLASFVSSTMSPGFKLKQIAR